MSEMTTSGREIEAKLVVAEGDREGLVREVLAMRRLGPYLLNELRPREIHDRYYDTAGGDLALRRVALRLRRQDGDWIVTIKGPARILPGGAQDRLEIERRWHTGALDEIFATLVRLGVAITRPSGSLEGASDAPEDAFRTAGLRPVHSREVCRAVRAATLATDRDRPVAELAVDAVTFRVGTRSLLHYEIEIEGLTVDSAETVRIAVEELRRRFGSALRLWSWDKLRLGIALEELDAADRMANLVDSHGHLLDAGYDAVEERLERS